MRPDRMAGYYESGEVAVEELPSIAGPMPVEPKREFISIPLLVMTVENYVNTSGDVNLLSRCWDAVKRLCLH